MVRTKARACTGKVPHATRRAAAAHLRSLIERGASPVVYVVYRCRSDPSHWHVGHRIPKNR